jgi:hypothetical protein
MNDLSNAAKFLFTVACAVVIAGAVTSVSRLTHKMAEAAVEAQQHDQMSYGAFSRQLWRHSKLK